MSVSTSTVSRHSKQCTYVRTVDSSLDSKCASSEPKIITAPEFYLTASRSREEERGDEERKRRDETRARAREEYGMERPITITFNQYSIEIFHSILKRVNTSNHERR
jgi:hypothetical protein